jgi:hypothetical protein
MLQSLRTKVSRLRHAPRGRPCVICQSVGTTVLAHCNDQEFRGIGLKSPDILGAHLCQSCHDFVDGRTKGTTREQRRALWDLAFKRTILRLWEAGILGVDKPSPGSENSNTMLR